MLKTNEVILTMPVSDTKSVDRILNCIKKILRTGILDVDPYVMHAYI
jgi:hypothetical protein